MNLQICVKGGERLFDHGGDGSHVKTKDTCGAFECRLRDFYKAAAARCHMLHLVSIAASWRPTTAGCLVLDSEC